MQYSIGKIVYFDTAVAYYYNIKYYIFYEFIAINTFSFRGKSNEMAQRDKRFICKLTSE